MGALSPFFDSTAVVLLVEAPPPFRKSAAAHLWQHCRPPMGAPPLSFDSTGSLSWEHNSAPLAARSHTHTGKEFAGGAGLQLRRGLPRRDPAPRRSIQRWSSTRGGGGRGGTGRSYRSQDGTTCGSTHSRPHHHRRMRRWDGAEDGACGDGRGPGRSSSAAEM